MATILSAPELHAEYRRLLLADWDATFPESVLTLLRRCVTFSPDEEAGIGALLDPDAAGISEQALATFDARLAVVAPLVPVRGLPPLDPAYRPSRKPGRAALLALRLAAAVTLHRGSEGATEFLLDVQTLAFHAAVHGVLPKLKAESPERPILLHALALFPLEYAGSDPAQFAYLMAELHGAVGNDDERLRSLYAAFRMTPPEDHAFLTRAQEYWMELLDHDRHQEAERFLYSLHFAALPEQQVEVREMVLTALQHLAAPA